MAWVDCLASPALIELDLLAVYSDGLDCSTLLDSLARLLSFQTNFTKILYHNAWLDFRALLGLRFCVGLGKIALCSLASLAHIDLTWLRICLGG